jgi:hypothetical protein
MPTKDDDEIHRKHDEKLLHIWADDGGPVPEEDAEINPGNSNPTETNPKPQNGAPSTRHLPDTLDCLVNSLTPEGAF